MQRPGSGGQRGLGAGTEFKAGPTDAPPPDDPAEGAGGRPQPNPQDLEKAKQLDQLAPIPGLPDFWSNVRFHRGTVKFTVELRDAAPPAAAPTEGQQ